MGMEGEGYKAIAVALLFIFSLLFAYYFLLQGAPQKEVTSDVFYKSLSSSRDVFIIADLRNATQSAKGGIMQCGVDMAGSVNLAAAESGLPEKNVSMFVIDGDSCVSAEWSKSIAYCEALSKSGVTIRLAFGNSTAFYENEMVIRMNQYVSQCTVSQVRVQNRTINQTANRSANATPSNSS